MSILSLDIKRHLFFQVNGSEDLDAQEDVNGNLDIVGEEASPTKSLFVTSRRGKTTKRKVSDGEQPLATAEVNRHSRSCIGNLPVKTLKTRAF